MALVDIHHAFVSIGDSRKKTSTVRYRITAAQANTYFSAVTQILKDATPVGVLLVATEALAKGNMMSKGVVLETIDDAVGFPGYDTDIFNFDKLAVHYASGMDNYQVTIPTRDTTNYTMETDGVHVNPTLGLVDEYIAAFNAVVLGKNGVAGVVTEITVPS